MSKIVVEVPGGSMSKLVVEGPGGSMSKVVGLPNNSYKPIRAQVAQ
jgi:hypothetical protein